MYVLAGCRVTEDVPAIKKKKGQDDLKCEL